MRRLSVVLLVPLLFVGFSCGGGDDDDGAVASDETTITTVGGGSGKGFCAKAAAFDQEMNDLDKTFSGSEVPTSDVFKKTAVSINELADDAPDEIKADLKTIAEGVSKIGEVLSDIDLTDTAALSDPANAEKLQQVSQEMESVGTDVQDASVRVGDYLRDECGIDIDGESTSTTAG